MPSAVDAWLPKSVILLRNYDHHKFVSDLGAGVTVGLEDLNALPPIVILRLRNMTAIDATGLGAIRELAINSTLPDDSCTYAGRVNSRHN